MCDLFRDEVLRDGDCLREPTRDEPDSDLTPEEEEHAREAYEAWLEHLLKD